LPHDADRELAELRTRYREKFARELDSLEALLRECASAGHGRTLLEEIRDRAHRLMGTSGSYGLDASSAALARMEARLERLLAGPVAEVAVTWPEVAIDLMAARAGLTT
jgi:chemotaxis protein histidine kinase CheA